MALTTNQIRSTNSDADLLRLLQGELNLIFPVESRRDLPVFLSRLQTVPIGLRSMAATFELDVSMALDDLACHFMNHHDLDFYEETRQALRELEAAEAADLFEKAFAIVKSHWKEMEKFQESEDFGDFNDWLKATGIEEQINPLDKRMRNLLDQWPKEGLMHYWVTYARKYPERCLNAN